ncbi:MAG: HlyD family efflux transporter periplasmic adaptor subunit [Streptosporangiaceae bacterium]
MTERSRRPGTRRLRRLAVLGISGLVVVAGAGTTYATVSSSSGPAYRLASVTPAQVTAALDVVGTLNPVQQADVPFAVSGTVTSVAVKGGQQVTAGQKLGSLSKASLKAGLTAAQAAVAHADLQVSNDIANQDTAASGSGSGSASGSGPGPEPGRGSSPGQTASSLRPLQQAVLHGQRGADHGLAQARIALAQANRVCAAPSGPGPSATPSPSLSAAPTVSPAQTATGAGDASPKAAPTRSARPSPAPTSSPGRCASATREVLAAETVVLHAQQMLSRQLTALGAALAKAIAEAGTSSSTGGSGGATSGGSGSGGGSSGAVTTGSGHGTVSAAQLAADQATADADAAQVTVAQQDLANATVLSPISGTVVSVDVSPGAAATAGSTAFEIAGLDNYQVLTDVPVTDLPALRVGQRASVQPDGLNRPLAGSVVSIGLIPDTSASPVTYPVTIGITGQPAAALHASSFADVTITTGRSRGVSVPTSAVHYSGRSATVTVYSAGQTHSVKVRTGMKGLVMTRITAGLEAGQHVVLADLRKPLPSNNLPGLGGPGIAAVNVAGPP